MKPMRGWWWRLPLLFANAVVCFWLLALPGAWPAALVIVDLAVLLLWLHFKHGPFSFSRVPGQPDPEPPAWRRR